MDDKSQPLCGHWEGSILQYCGAAEAVRVYLIGRRCPAHTPAALAGKPEPPARPGWPAQAWTTPSPQSASALFDARAIASGKRRAAAHTYRAAQTAVAQRNAPRDKGGAGSR